MRHREFPPIAGFTVMLRGYGENAHQRMVFPQEVSAGNSFRLNACWPGSLPFIRKVRLSPAVACRLPIRYAHPLDGIIKHLSIVLRPSLATLQTSKGQV